MAKRIVIIDGHPDPREERFCRAVATAYAKGAETSRHLVRRISIAELGLTPLTSRDEWEGEWVPDPVLACQEDIEWAEHLVIIYPLWLGDMPALLKAFFEQVLRPKFGLSHVDAGSSITRLLKGRSARVVVTMGMPSLWYWLYYGGHGVRSLRHSLLGYVGISPIRITVIGSVEAGGEPRHRRWLDRINALGCAAR